jgi:hypothetical protein
MSSCNETDKGKDLVGKWKLVFDREACLKNMPKGLRKTFDAQPKAQQEAILKEIAVQVERDNWIEFKQDNSFEQVLLEGETKKVGKWQIKGGTQILLQLFKNKDDKSPERETCEIVTLNKNALVLKTNSPHAPQLVFNRASTKPALEAPKTTQKAQIK